MAAKVFKPMKMEMLKELMPAAAHLQEEEELSNSNSNSASNGRVSEEKERPILIRNPFKRQTTNASADAEPSSPTRNSLNNILSSSPSRGKLTNRQLSQNDRSSKAHNSGDFGGRSRTASGTSLTLPLPLPLPLTTTTAAAAAAASSSSSSSSSANPPSPGPNTAGTHALLDEELNTSI